MSFDVSPMNPGPEPGSSIQCLTAFAMRLIPRSVEMSFDVSPMNPGPEPGSSIQCLTAFAVRLIPRSVDA